MFFIKPKSVEDFDSKIISFGQDNISSSSRKSVHIAVIDDEKFHPEISLAKNGYNIKVFEDIERIDDVESYQIVLCDLSGVGIKLNSDTQGAHLIKEIKATYPDKVVIAYTAGSPSGEYMQKVIKSSDYYLQKDADLDSWQETLDKSISEVLDPIKSWKKIRKKLLDHNIRLCDLTKLEDAFVKDLSKGGKNYKIQIPQLAKNMKLDKEIIKIISNSLTKTLFNLALNHNN